MIPKFIASQFKKPKGLLGIFSSNLMITGNQKKYDRLIKDMDLQAHDKLLEIGYGPGTGIQTIAKLCSTCKIHGIDFSELMYKRAAKYNKQFIDGGRVELQYGDFLKIPVIGNNYDKIFCLNVIYFWDRLQDPFERILSILKKGGSFHMYMLDENTLRKKAPDSVFNKYSIEHVVEALKSAGFATVEHYEDKGHYIKAKK